MSTEVIWKHFKEVIVPEIRVRQIQQRSSQVQQNAVGPLILQFAKAASKSEVLGYIIIILIHIPPCSHIILTVLLYGQVLNVINPDVMYHVVAKRLSKDLEPESKNIQMKGVAIRLKEFLARLDRYSIPHDTEHNIRKWIRGNALCNSYMKQHFLRSNSTLTKISRSVQGATCCKTCVCIAKQYIPDLFFECVSGKHPASLI